MKKYLILFIFLLTTTSLLGGCSTPPEDTPTPTPTKPPAIEPLGNHLLISEVLAGVEGNNLYDYIELYNPSLEIIDLKGYSLWYQLKEEDEPALVLVWDESYLVPPFGHFLLGQENQDFGIRPDLFINQPLQPARGGLTLKDPAQEMVDSLGWGNAPTTAIEGSPADQMTNGLSLVRLANSTDTNNNQADFSLVNFPTPENTGSPTTPKIPHTLALNVSVVDTVSPGDPFDYSIQLTNNSLDIAEQVSINLTIPDQFEIIAVAEGADINGQAVTFTPGDLASGEGVDFLVSVKAPLTYSNQVTHSYYAQAANIPIPVFGPPLPTNIAGGSIPIAVARELIDQEVVIEGIATMYTGGFYAGSGAKFYLTDGTAGVQVYVAGAGNTLRVNIGDRVRVQGIVSPYRGALEVVPANEALVEILEPKVEEILPTLITVNEIAANGDAFKGTLVQVEGTLARVEEFTYSYEIDIVDTEGKLATAYLDKETGITIDTISSGDNYKVTGIIEGLDNNILLYPRLQTDLEKIFPEELIITAQAPVSISPGEGFEISYIVTNHTKQTATDLGVFARIPDGVEIIEIGEGGELVEGYAHWLIEAIEGNGTTSTVTLTVRPMAGMDYVTITSYTVSIMEASTRIEGETTYTFTTGQVPIWAIQGTGARTPYNQYTVQTSGVVTGIFPGLNGFWIQETITDSDPATSPGLFVDTGNLSAGVAVGDLVEVSGIVRESYLQTQLTLGALTQLEIVGSGSPLPVPISLDPPADDQASDLYYESLEGALVTVNENAVVVEPSSRYGEFAFVLASHGRERLYRGEENGVIIMADDGSSVSHNDQSTLPYTLTTGDLVTNLTGPLAYTYGNYKLEPTTPPTITPGEQQITPQPVLGEDQFSIMTWNVENLFDILDPHPSSPPLPTVSEYRVQITKVAQTIVDAGLPTIIGLQEVENIGVLERIADHELIRDYGYIPVLIEGTDSRYIDVGYLVRGDRAEVLAEEQFPAPEGITSRPPLLVQVKLAGRDTEIFLLNNHFTSMSGGEEATEPRRNAQAAWNVTVMEKILTENPGALLAVIGDLNSYYDSLPLDTLRDAGLMHSFDRLPNEARYTYVYEGVSQTIDHILITPELDALISEVVVLHFNADFPLPLPDDLTSMHKSDHDPVLVVFEMP
ncbi:MAG: endonuclease/exonuclease/phosphatase family protein [Anaerolineales bacterium]|nr:endonuclease/exonuclease/phosphatase family protein [Anaerolineales bacterium]